MARELTDEEQEELWKNLDLRKALAEEILSHYSCIDNLNYAKNKLSKRYYEILENANIESGST